MSVWFCTSGFTPFLRGVPAKNKNCQAAVAVNAIVAHGTTKIERTDRTTTYYVGPGGGGESIKELSKFFLP